MNDTNGEVRRILLDHSDHRAVRNVFGERTDGVPARLDDYVETVRVTGGELALVGRDGASDVYARWNGASGRFEQLSIWPPWTIAGYDHADRAALVEYLGGLDDVGLVPYETTPFADEDVLAGLSDRIWS